MTSTEFDRQFTALNSKLMSFAMRLTRNQADANDLIQETAYRAFKSRERFRPGTNFKAWVTTIMHNSFINEYRRKKKRSHVNEPVDTFLYAIEDTNVVANAGLMSCRMQEFKEMFALIGEDYSVPFLMFHRGYHYDEIAEQLKLPMGTVKSRIFFARKKLKALIADWYGE